MTNQEIKQEMDSHLRTVLKPFFLSMVKEAFLPHLISIKNQVVCSMRKKDIKQIIAIFNDHRFLSH